MAIAKLIAKHIAGNIRKKYQDETGQLDLLLAELNSAQRKFYDDEYQSRKKSLQTAYTCWMCLGSHYLYVKKPSKQIVFWMTLGGVGAWFILDLFLMFFVVDSYNRKVGFEIINEIFEDAREAALAQYPVLENPLPIFSENLSGESEIG